MTRGRKQVCGVRPTFATAPEPEVPVVNDPPKAQTAEAPKPTTTTTTTTTRSAAAKAPAAQTRVVKRQAAAPKATPKAVPRKAAATSTRKPMATVASKPAAPKRTTTRRAAAPKPQPKTRVVAAAPKPAAVRTPRGYKRVWTDGRLNPLRGERTQAGREQMALLWTQDVPHRLIDVRTGKDVTAKRPEMVYPYTSYAEQQRDLGPSTRTTASTKAASAPKTRRVVKKIVRNKSTGEIISVSSKSAPKEPVAGKTAVVKKARTTTAQKPAKAAAGRYVQVGTFGGTANAKRTAARLQSAGLPVRIQGINRGGRRMEIVLAGPLAGDALAAGLRKARAMGFGDAFVR